MPRGSPRTLGGAVREHLVGVHVVRRAGAGLVDVDDELIAVACRRGSRRRPRRSRRRRARSSRPSVAVGPRGRLLDEHRGGHELGGRGQAADRESSRPRAGSARPSRPLPARAPRRADRARRVTADAAPVALLPRIRRHFQLNYTARMLPSFFDSVVALITRTSTDLPPDVRQAMAAALATEERQHARGAGADDHRAEHRSGGVAAKGRSARTPACRPSRSRCRSAPTRSG